MLVMDKFELLCWFIWKIIRIVLLFFLSYIFWVLDKKFICYYYCFMDLVNLVLYVVLGSFCLNFFFKKLKMVNEIKCCSFGLIY